MGNTSGSIPFTKKIMSALIGISCHYHDSAACLIVDGEIKFGAQEERFSRIKHDKAFPNQAIEQCLQSIELNNYHKQGLEIVYYEKPLLTFERLLETYIATAPRGSRSFVKAMRTWLSEKLFIKRQLKKKAKEIAKRLELEEVPVLFSEHHLSHASAAFYPSPFNEAAILCMDGVGEWATTSAWIGKGNTLQPLWEISFPHSLGLLYSAFTYYCGFKVNSGEYKLMGLAPYGKPIHVDTIKEHLIDIKDDGTFRLNLKYFKYQRGLRMTSRKFHQLFGAPPRKPESELTQFHMDLAASIQKVTEDVVLSISRALQAETGQKNICLAGGVALNCVANGHLQREGPFEKLWIQPASGDAGSSLGAALAARYQHHKHSRHINPADSMAGTYIGPKFSNSEITDYLNQLKAPYKLLRDEELFRTLAKLLEEGKVVGWFNGRMEFGPRSLGGRSILGDPRNSNMQRTMNLKIKYRESFRPFAPAILEEEREKFFQLSCKSPYMLLVAKIQRDKCIPQEPKNKQLFGIEQLNLIRSEVPAITHVDYSARVQTVSKQTNPRFYGVISAFKERTGCPVLVNTSFNVRGEPIVCTPEDAYRCFMRTEMDALVLENHLLLKKDQANKEESDTTWMQEFELD